MWIALMLGLAVAAVAQTPSVVVTFRAGAGGTIKATVDGYDIASGSSVDSGKIVVFMADPDPEYTIADWRYNGRVTNATNNRFIVQIDGETSVIEVTVSFKRKPPTSAVVVFRADGSGTLTATVDGVLITSGDLVSIGKRVVFSAVPAAGYGIARWTVNGTVIVDTLKYTHSVEITSAIALTGLSVIASFEKRLPPSAVVKFRPEDAARGALTATVDGVRIASGDTVIVGKTVVFTAFPAAGYDIALWKVNGTEYEIVDTSQYTYEVNITNTAPVNVTVSFEEYDDLPDALEVPLKGFLTFGPNPVRSGGDVAIFWDGEKEISGDLFVFNAVGNIIDRRPVGGTGKIGEWNTRGVATGTYLMRGMLRDKDGFTCRVLMLVGVVR